MWITSRKPLGLGLASVFFLQLLFAESGHASTLSRSSSELNRVMDVQPMYAAKVKDVSEKIWQNILIDPAFAGVHSIPKNVEPGWIKASKYIQLAGITVAGASGVALSGGVALDLLHSLDHNGAESGFFSGRKSIGARLGIVFAIAAGVFLITMPFTNRTDLLFVRKDVDGLVGSLLVQRLRNGDAGKIKSWIGPRGIIRNLREVAEMDDVRAARAELVQLREIIRTKFFAQRVLYERLSSLLANETGDIRDAATDLAFDLTNGLNPEY